MRHFPPTFAALAFTLVTSLAQAEIHWETNLRTAHGRAQQEGKLLLLHFYSDNCVWCDRLEAGAFKAPAVAEAIHRHYVPVKVHAGQNPTVAKTFRVNAYPTDVIVTTEGTALSHTVSPQAPDQYVAMLNQHTAAAVNPTMVANDTATAQTPPALQLVAPPQAADVPMTSGYMLPSSHGDLATHPTIADPAASGNSPIIGTPATPASYRNSADASAAPPKKTPPKLALDGYCAVSISEKSEWIEGSPELGVIHLGNLYLFVDETAMAKFLANPEPYTPVLNGIDVVRFFEEKKIVPGKRDFGVKDPQYNRMFFFSDEAAMVHFENQHTRYTDAAIIVTRQAVADANPRR